MFSLFLMKSPQPMLIQLGVGVGPGVGEMGVELPCPDLWLRVLCKPLHLTTHFQLQGSNDDPKFTIKESSGRNFPHPFGKPAISQTHTIILHTHWWTEAFILVNSLATHRYLLNKYMKLKRQTSSKPHMHSQYRKSQINPQGMHVPGQIKCTFTHKPHV